MNLHPTRGDDWLAPRPMNLIGRQWRRARGQTGWRWMVAVAGIGCEVVAVIAIVLLLVL